MSGNLPSETVTYDLSFLNSTAGVLGSITIEFCSNYPFEGDACVAPNGFDASGAVLSSQSPMNDFTIQAGQPANVLMLTRTPQAEATTTFNFKFDNIVNPSSLGSYYARLHTYTTSDASNSPTDYGSLAFSISDNINISAEVPPYILLCTGITINGYDCAAASGNYVKFGELLPNRTSTGQTQILVATNADNGYNLRVMGATLTSGNHIIKPLETSDIARPGLQQFGLNLAANTSPAIGASPAGPGAGNVAPDYAQANLFRFVPGEIIASANSADDLRRFTVSYIVNITDKQWPGVYVSTLTYVGLANF